MKSLSKLPDPGDLIREGTRLLGIRVDEDAVSKMLRYIDMLQKWKSRVNLTSLSDRREIALYHFVDCLTVFKVLGLGSGARILDVGTGGGFPGLVLRSADPSINLSLLDKNARKIVFLKVVAQELDLEGIEFFNMTLEEFLANPPYYKFDFVLSRAFSSDSRIMDSLHVLLPAEGSLIRMAGPEELVKEFTLVNFRQSVCWEGVLPFSTVFRRVIMYRKICVGQPAVFAS
jgi:16S rRNA (guanine527-N7)-methyltransferase